jgi:hypothetical protein
MDVEGKPYFEEDCGSITAIPSEIRHLLLILHADRDNPLHHHSVAIPEGAAPICVWTTPIVIDPNTMAQRTLEPIIGIGWEMREDGSTEPAKTHDWDAVDRCRCVTWVMWDGSAVTTNGMVNLRFLENMAVSA